MGALETASPAAADDEREFQRELLESITLERVTGSTWRVCDSRACVGSASRTLGFVERLNDGFVVIQIALDIRWLVVASMRSAIGHIVKTHCAIIDERAAGISRADSAAADAEQSRPRTTPDTRRRPHSRRSFDPASSPAPRSSAPRSSAPRSSATDTRAVRQARHDREALAGIVATLGSRFPLVSGTVVERIVDHRYLEYYSEPLRDRLLLLVRIGATRDIRRYCAVYPPSTRW